MTVKAKDAAGNVSASSAALNVTTIKSIVSYTLTVNSGTGSGHYLSGFSVNIAANVPETGKLFDKWTGTTTGIADINSAATTITMPAANTSITANYKDQVGLENNPLSKIEIYPNPVHTTVTISSLDKDAFISVISTSGLILIQKQITENQTILDLSNLSSGVYIIKINSVKDVVEYKIIKD